MFLIQYKRKIYKRFIYTPLYEHSDTKTSPSYSKLESTMYCPLQASILIMLCLCKSPNILQVSFKWSCQDVSTSICLFVGTSRTMSNEGLFGSPLKSVILRRNQQDEIDLFTSYLGWFFGLSSSWRTNKIKLPQIVDQFLFRSLYRLLICRPIFKR